MEARKYKPDDSTHIHTNSSVCTFYMHTDISLAVKNIWQRKMKNTMSYTIGDLLALNIAFRRDAQEKCLAKEKK